MARITPFCQPPKRTFPPLVQALSVKIDAGAYVRCPSCYEWCDRSRISHVSLFMPHDGRPHVAYAICRRCWNHSLASSDQQSAMVARIETYLDGNK